MKVIDELKTVFWWYFLVIWVISGLFSYIIQVVTVYISVESVTVLRLLKETSEGSVSLSEDRK